MARPAEKIGTFANDDSRYTAARFPSNMLLLDAHEGRQGFIQKPAIPRVSLRYTL